MDATMCYFLQVFVTQTFSLLWLWFLMQCEKLVDPDSGVEGRPACDLRAVGKKFDKSLYTSLVCF